MGYTITPINEQGIPTDLQVTSKLAKAKKIAERTKAHKVEVRQIRGNWARLGTYMLGIKRANGYYDWQLVPNDSHKPFDQEGDKMIDAIIKAFKQWWERHIVMDYEKTNHPYECFPCNLGTCKGCPLKGMTRQQVEDAKKLGTLRTTC